ncbi:hypothetical protein FRX31_003107 [Thalictrum thalictroides]|uniref:Uncharacterized protein n=1 Tax=Thalictrum thalictroides TaxID=46969 RepID=A0A7J6XBX4_THATH|nr:hypothetical protein FRX31_003107 [Thalictrum thalictroides]
MGPATFVERSTTWLFAVRSSLYSSGGPNSCAWEEQRVESKRWARARRFTSVMERLFASMRRSMFERHFDNFQSFRDDGLHEFCTLVAEAEPSIEIEITNFFPQFPARITQEKWKDFKPWLNSDMGEPVRDIRLPWSRYGRYTQQICAEVEIQF